MNDTWRQTIVKWLLVVFASKHALLVTYLGHFSRLIVDELCIIATSRALDTWDALTHFYITWTGAYTRNFLILLLSALDRSLASIVPIAPIVLGFAA